MKTVSKTKIEKAERLAALIEMRKEIEKEEKSLKDFFKTELEISNVIEAGNVVIMKKDCKRTGLDKELLVQDLGDISKYETVTEYVQIDVRKVWFMEAFKEHKCNAGCLLMCDFCGDNVCEFDYENVKLVHDMSMMNNKQYLICSSCFDKHESELKEVP